jgi:hypothetical protein
VAVVGYQRGRYGCPYHENKQAVLTSTRPDAIFVPRSDHVEYFNTSGSYGSKPIKREPKVH